MAKTTAKVKRGNGQTKPAAKKPAPPTNGTVIFNGDICAVKFDPAVITVANNVAAGLVENARALNVNAQALGALTDVLNLSSLKIPALVQADNPVIIAMNGKLVQQ